MIRLSTVIITYNEEERIANCIRSVQDVSDEILVVDSYSTDNTVEICKMLGTKVLMNKFDGFIEQKNFALANASFDYVLLLDADEQLSSGAQQKILDVKQNCTHQAHSLNRLTFYEGVPIRHCGWYPDKKVHLLDRRHGKWGGKNPHAKIVLNKDIKTLDLDVDILHFTYKSLTHHLEKINQYSTVAAEEVIHKSTSYLLLKLVVDPHFHFFRNYLLKKGFLDGVRGFVICSLSGYMRFAKYAKAVFMKLEKQ